MDASVFGDYLCKYAAVSDADMKAYEQALEEARQNNQDLPQAPSCYQRKLVADLSPTQYVCVFFTAEYCPPCKAVEQPFKDFVDAFNKDSQRLQVVVVNCDKRREEYDDHAKRLSDKYLLVPFENSEAQCRLEDLAEAANIPRVSMFVTRKGFGEFAVKDVKKSILKCATMTEAVTEVINMCEH